MMQIGQVVQPPNVAPLTFVSSWIQHHSMVIKELSRAQALRPNIAQWPMLRHNLLG